MDTIPLPKMVSKGKIHYRLSSPVLDFQIKKKSQNTEEKVFQKNKS